VILRGLRWPSADADALALAVLDQMGVTIHADAAEVSGRARRGSLRTVSVHAADFPDAVPALAALAAFASGESRFSGIGHLRLKESDRIAALAALLTAAGGRAAAEADALVVAGPLPTSLALARLPTAGDHRIAMAAGLIALGRQDVLIESPSCVSKSYPRFFRDLDAIAVRGHASSRQ
jgi:3-phosphoshikimate 1-carboxyvinyltransferase